MTFQVPFVILILFSTYFCVQVHATDYYFSNFCKSGIGNLSIYPTSSGVGRSGYISESSSYGGYSNGLNCTLLLTPFSGYGITLTVQEINLRRGQYTSCLDTVTIQWSSGTSSYGPWYTEMSSCSQTLRKEYSNYGPMRINFKSGYSTESTTWKTFRIYYSTYYNGSTRNPGAIAGGVVGAIVIVILVIAIVFICRRRAVVVRSTCTTTVCAPPTTTVYAQQAYPPPQPPPYSYHQQYVPQQTNYYTQPQP